MNSGLNPIESEEESAEVDRNESEIVSKVVNLNHLAMKNLELQRPNHVLIYLNQGLLSCKQLRSESRSRLLALTYNNLACYFQSIKSADKALEFLFKSVNLLTNSKDILNLGASHLNISYILFSQAQHERSLRHALKTIYLLRSRHKASVTLIKAYLAAGNLYKTLKQVQDASDCYEQGLALSRRCMGSNYDLTLQFKAALDSIQLETLSKQKTSKVIRRFNPVLHRRSRTGLDEVQKTLPVKSTSKGSHRTRLIQEKMIATGRTLTSHRMRPGKDLQSRSSLDKARESEFKPDSSKVVFANELKSDQSLSQVKRQQRLSQDFNDLKELKQSLQLNRWDKVEGCLQGAETKGNGRLSDCKKRRFDIQNQRLQERLAAVVLQAWWKGRRQRWKFLALKEEREIEIAELKAKQAAEYALKLRLKASAKASPRKVPGLDLEKMKLSALAIQKVFRGYKGRNRFRSVKEKLSLARVVVAKFLIKIKSKSSEGKV